MSAKSVRGREWNGERNGKRNEALRLLRLLRGGAAKCRIASRHRLACKSRCGTVSISVKRLAELAGANLVQRIDGRITLTEEGRAHLVRHSAASEPFLVQHGGGGPPQRVRHDPVDAVLVDEAESPLAWLARRRGPGGKPLIDAAQFQAGERLRADFTRAGLTPRVTSNWEAPIAQGRRAGGAGMAAFSDSVLAARERVSMTLEVVGPEFAGLLLDVCCFLKGLETVERERGWPQRTAKIVLGLALDRLARHYRIRTELHGPARSPSRYWRAPDARPGMGGS